MPGPRRVPLRRGPIRRRSTSHEDRRHRRLGSDRRRPRARPARRRPRGDPAGPPDPAHRRRAPLGPPAPPDRPGPARRRRRRGQPRRDARSAPGRGPAAYKQRLLTQPAWTARRRSARRWPRPPRPTRRGARVLLSASARRLLRRHRRRAPSPRRTPPGTDFLAQLCAQWEAATAPARGGRASGSCTAADRPGDRPRGAMLMQVLGPGLPPRPRRPHGLRAGSTGRGSACATRSARSGSCSRRDVSGPVNLTGPDAGHQRRVHPQPRPRRCTARRSCRCPGSRISLALGEFGRSSVAGRPAGPAGAACRSPGSTFTHTDARRRRCGRRSPGADAEPASGQPLGAVDPPPVRRSGPAPCARRRRAGRAPCRSAAPSGPPAGTTS